MAESQTTLLNRTWQQQIDDVNAIAIDAFAAGDTVTGIAAVKLAADILQLARIKEGVNPNG